MKPNNFTRMGIICTQKTHLHCSALTKSPAGRDTIHFMEKRTPALNYVIRQDTAPPGLCLFCQKKAEDFASIHVVEKRVQTASRGPGTRQSRSEAEDTIHVVKKRTSASQRRLCRAVSRREDIRNADVICVHPRSGEAGAKADEC
jgi:hypothetical protein